MGTLTRTVFSRWSLYILAAEVSMLNQYSPPNLMSAARGLTNATRQRRETRHCPRTLDPVWGESFVFSLQVT
jgi:hypothetical protein